MPCVYDVAAFILTKTGAVTPLKLQKLVYYTQAWSLVRDGHALFPETFQAWRYGPVCPPLYQKHPGAAVVPIPYPYGDPETLPADGCTTALAVVHVYGKKPPQWLSDLTHREAPWKEARAGLPADAWSDAEISVDAMRAYYSSTPSHAREQILTFQPGKANSLIDFMQSMTDDEASVVDELAQLDVDPEIAKLTA